MTTTTALRLDAVLGDETTTVHLNSTSRPDEQCMGCFLVLFYATVLIATFGIIGNALSIAVFVWAANFRRTSTVQYLISLAVTDSLYLIGELFYTISTPAPDGTFLTSINFVYTTDFGCKSIIWLRYRS
jgi:hypothetical protein